MRLEHVAIWVKDLDNMKKYYMDFFDAKSNELYNNTNTGFNSYFLTFKSGARLELMTRNDIPDNLNDTIDKQHKGIIHLAFSVDTMAEVDNKAKELESKGYRILRGPRRSGDGYYEFETLDPENNRLEVITTSYE